MVYDPVERAAASDLLSHEYIISVPEGGVIPVAAPPTSSATIANPGAAPSTSALTANELYYAARLAGGAPSNATAPAAGAPEVGSTAANGSSSESMQTDATGAGAVAAVEGDAGNESINSKDVLRNRRTDIPNTTTKVR